MLRGKLFDGRSSAAYDAEASLEADGVVRIALVGGEDGGGAPLRDIKISERIGNTPRRLTFPSGVMFETQDNDALDEWLTTQRGHSLEYHVFRLEQRWVIAIAALILTLFGSWLAIRYGVPAAAGYAAKMMPPQVDATIGREGLLLLDKAFFEPSELARDKQEVLRGEFDAMVRDVNDAHEYRLEFRKGGETVGPNAFALPSGIVVVTDELVALAEDPREITAVLAHEIGHVVHRHSLRMILQSSATAALMVALFGDFTSVSSLIAATPAVLVQAKYSRELETEADDFSYAWMKKHGIPSHFLGDMLKRLEAAHDETSNEKGDTFDFFSTHPRVEERIRPTNSN